MNYYDLCVEDLFGEAYSVNFKKERDVNQYKYSYVMHLNDHWSKARTHFGSNTFHILGVYKQDGFDFIAIILKRYKFHMISYSPYIKRYIKPYPSNIVPNVVYYNYPEVYYCFRDYPAMKKKFANIINVSPRVLMS